MLQWRVLDQAVNLQLFSRLQMQRLLSKRIHLSLWLSQNMVNALQSPVYFSRAQSIRHVELQFLHMEINPMHSQLF